MSSSKLAKLTRTALATAVAASGVIMGAAFTAGTAHAESSVGGQISRDEVIVRANDWYNRNVQYNRGSWVTDLGGSKTYRTDCSGFVSMTWHLNSSETTDSLDVRSLTTRVALTDLQPGDALDNDPHDNYLPDSAHVVLFDHWIDKAAGYFAFIAESSTDNDMQKGTAYINKGYIGGHPADGYFGLRYNNIVGPVSERGNLYHTVRNASGSWSGFAAVGGYDGAPVFNASQESIAATPDKSTQTVALGSDGNLYHTARYADGTWTGWAPVAGYDGAPTFAATSFSIAGMPNGDAQILAVGKDGLIYHNIRFVNGTWQGWGQVGSWGAQKVAITGMPNGDAQMLIIGNDGLIYHNARFAGGSWQGWNGVAGVGSASSFAAKNISIAGMPNGDAQMIAVGSDSNVYHNNRLVSGSWQGWNAVAGVGSAANFASSSIAITGMPNGDTQLVGVGTDGIAYHNARFAGGSWQGWNSLGFGAINVSIAGVADGSAQIIGTHS